MQGHLALVAHLGAPALVVHEEHLLHEAGDPLAVWRCRVAVVVQPVVGPEGGDAVHHVEGAELHHEGGGLQGLAGSTTRGPGVEARAEQPVVDGVVLGAGRAVQVVGVPGPAPFGRRLVGVPYEFRSAREEEAFYEERRALLRDLNAVRLRHPELFPGSFRDLVRQGVGDDLFLVWVVRPLLEGAMDLDRYLATERPDAPLGEKVSILRRVAEALAALEQGGYTLAVLSPQLVFFVPPPADAAAEPSPTQAGLTRPVAALFDITATVSGRRFRQELMGTASAVKATPDATGRVVAGFFEMATRIRVLSALQGSEKDAFLQLSDAQSWAERVDLLRWVEARLRG